MKINGTFVIDSNIIIYSFDKKSKYYNYSKEIILNNKGFIFIAHKSITEFVAVLSKMNKYNVIEIELSNLLNDFNILYPDKKSIGIFQELAKKYKPQGNRVYDCEIVSVMIANEIKSIVTINKSDFELYKEINIITKDEKIEII